MIVSKCLLYITLISGLILSIALAKAEEHQDQPTLTLEQQYQLVQQDDVVIAKDKSWTASATRLWSILQPCLLPISVATYLWQRSIFLVWTTLVFR